MYDLGFLSGDQLYYTMRYIEGNNFSQIIREREIDLEERLRILRSAALAVEYAHSQGLWHRDIKPQNILVGSLGDACVTDWGLVSVRPNQKYELNLPKIVVNRTSYIMPPIPDQLLERTNTAVTATQGPVIGTFEYMSPEQVRSESPGGSFGCLGLSSPQKQHLMDF